MPTSHISYRAFLNCFAGTAAILLLTACGGDAPVNDAAWFEAGADETIEADGLRSAVVCLPPAEEVHEDWVPMPIAMADVGRWLHVESIVEGNVDTAAAGDPLTVMASSSADSKPERQDVQIWSGAIPMLEAALRSSDVEVYFGVGSATGQLAENVVWVPLAVSQSEFSVIGQCDAVRSNNELDVALGDKSFEIVSSAIWLTGEDLQRTLQQEVEPTPPGPPQIVPGLTHDDEAMRGYTAHELMVEWPDDVRSDDYSVCVRSGENWGGCVLLGAIPPGFGPYTLGFAVPEDVAPSAEVWLLGGSSEPSEPMLLIAEIPSELLTQERIPVVQITAFEPGHGSKSAADVKVQSTVSFNEVASGGCYSTDQTRAAAATC